MSEKRTEHAPENCWYDGEKYIPVTEMTESHLRRAKLFAQKKEEYHWHKSGEFSEMVEMLEQEAQRRGIKLKDYRSKYHKNNRTLKNAINTGTSEG